MRTLIIGLDAFDPTVFERLQEGGRLPNLSRLLEIDGYRHFSISNPAQSEVSWTSIATGLNPGGHGIFDFVHRDPETYLPYVSLLPTKSVLSGTQFAPPHTARTIFEQAVRKGYPASVLWWPATFPARPELPVQTIPGLGTPDIYGKLGVGTLLTTAQGLNRDDRKTSIQTLKEQGKGRFSGALIGPSQKKGGSVQNAAVDLNLELTGPRSARVQVGKHVFELAEGEWSPIFEVVFKLGLFVKVYAITRVILTQTSPEISLYALPLQLHPFHSPWRYATPQSFVKGTWENCGSFLTVGWPQDTSALEDGCIDDEQFLALCHSIVDTREKILHYHLKNFREGILANVFDTLDRVQHMFWRDRPDVIEAWYEKLDGIVGRARALAERSGEVNLIVVSDHGFTNFNEKVHLNRWLIEKGYLVPKDKNGSGGLKDVDWSKTRAYALGLNSLYLNLAGREGKGIVALNEVEPLLNQIQSELLEWRTPEGKGIVGNAWRKDQALEGPLTVYGPDLLVGWAPGYRASAQTGLGSWESASLEPNKDHWGADHCINPESVPGVLFSNQGLGNYPKPSYRDIPVLAIGENLESNASAPPPSQSRDEDDEVIEERLKSLGYL